MIDSPRSLAAVAGSIQAAGGAQSWSAGKEGSFDNLPFQVPRTGIKVFSTNVPGQFPATDRKVIVFHTDEGAANMDLNGDTFITPGMYVIQYWDLATGVLVNTSEEGLYPSISKGSNNLFAFVRWEQNGGMNIDWNSDGDFQDDLIAYHDISTGTTTDTLVDGRYPDIDGDVIAFYTWESSVGPLPGTDLNGDLDMQDPVVRYHTISTGVTTSTWAAGFSPSVSGDTIAFSTWETYCWNGAGATEPFVPNPPDLNGDGDLTDYILRYHTISTGMNTFTTRDCIKPTIDGNGVAYGFDENDDDGPLDADSDMDTIDLVLQIFDVNLWTWTRPMLPITSTPTIKGRYIAFDLEEIYLGFSLAPAQGTELNGNGFPGDHIVCYYDTKTGAFTSTGVAGFCDSGDSLEKNIIVYDDQNTGFVGYILFP